MRDEEADTPAEQLTADLEAAFASQIAAGLGEVRLGVVATEQKSLVRRLVRLDPIHAATSFAGLLTVPSLQSNCARVEALVHLAIAVANGKQKLSDKLASSAFSAVGQGLCGLMEDPSEDCFASTVRSPRGNFRLLEGIWEGGAFFLQRFVNVVEDMPAGSGYHKIRDSVYALLRLSDIVCARTHIDRHHLGAERPSQRLDRRLLVDLQRRRSCLRFTIKQLQSAGIDPLALAPFVFRSSERHDLLHQTLGGTTLERRPLIRSGDELFLVLPTAVSAAIRYFVIERMCLAGMQEALAMGIARDYARTFNRTPILGGNVGANIRFAPTKFGPAATVAAKIDVGRYLQVLFFADDLQGVDHTGLGGMNPASAHAGEVLTPAIDEVVASVSKDPSYVGGMTIIVGCGVGRGAFIEVDPTRHRNWRIEFMSAYDFETLSWLPKFSPLKLCRILDARDKAEKLGLAIHNVNGLINLVAWAASLDGHIVPHERMPDDMVGPDRPLLMMVDQNAHRALRHQVAIAHDPRVEPFIDGSFVRIRKEASSIFDDDRAAPLYASDDLNERGRPRYVFLTTTRLWWAELEVSEDTPANQEYERWRTLGVWLSRAVPILDKILGLPNGPILWRAKFASGPRDRHSPLDRMTYEQCRAQITVEADSSARLISTVASVLYEDANFHPENIAERALVDALVTGAEMLARVSPDDLAHAKRVDAIVPDVHARHGHAILAKNYRDWFRGEVEHVVKITPEDDATNRLGLGWRVRDKSEGNRIHGPDECMAYLAKLVRSLEDDLIADIRSFSRRAMLIKLLRNMEAAAFDRDRWKRTAAAILALHKNRVATLRTMAQEEFKLNAVFQAGRILIEIAICECPLEEGREPGELDMSRMMSKAGLLYEIGGWSDAIRWGVMEPFLRITPLGDVHANFGFVDEIIMPHVYVASDERIAEAEASYAEQLEEIEPLESTDRLLAAEFQDAWLEQFGATVDETRAFVDYIEMLGRDRGNLVIELRLSDFQSVVVGERTISSEAVKHLLHVMTFQPRSSWRDTPPGFADRDRQPWRYRRRLSFLRRPLLQLDAADDPTFIIAPGLVRECLGYMLGNFLRGDFPEEQLSSKMKRWRAREADRRGAAFSAEVAAMLRRSGWEAQTEVKVTKILKRGLERDFGDVDVLAWHLTERRVLIIECKDVHFRKTFGEIAEQLADFRGELRPNGKPDYMRRHLDRMDLLSQHLEKVAAYLSIQLPFSMESYLVFKNPVPVEFAVSSLAKQVMVTNFARFGQIFGAAQN